MSSETFQKRKAALDGSETVRCVADDILVRGVGADEEEAQRNHDYNLERLLVRCRKLGIRLKDRKTELKRDNMVFLGHQLSNDGLNLDTEKVKAIQDMPQP